MIHSLIFAVFILLRTAGFAQTSFNKTYGGDGFDRGMYLAQTAEDWLGNFGIA